MISSNDDNFEYITIFGVNEGNLESIKKLFADYNPIYVGANYSDELIWNRSLKINENNDELSKSEKKNEFNNGSSIQREFRPTKIYFFDNFNKNNIGEAFFNSTGNWVYARFSLKNLEDVTNIKSKYVLDNDDIIYCMRGIYQGTGEFSKLPTGEEKDAQKLQSNDSGIYKLPKIENLVDLSFEGKPFYIKFNEFIIGNYEISKNVERKSNDNDHNSGNFILIISLVAFFVIFIYKVAK